jgi:hypothetical protein
MARRIDAIQSRRWVPPDDPAIGAMLQGAALAWGIRPETIVLAPIAGVIQQVLRGRDASGRRFTVSLLPAAQSAGPNLIELIVLLPEDAAPSDPLQVLGQINWGPEKEDTND